MDMRRGRLVVEAGATDNRTARVFVVPDDGGEPILLHCTEVGVHVAVNEFVTVELTAAAHRVDVAGVDEDGRELRLMAEGAQGRRATFAHVDVYVADSLLRTTSARWRLNWDGRNKASSKSIRSSTRPEVPAVAALEDADDAVGTPDVGRVVDVAAGRLERDVEEFGQPIA
ncbi:MAG: hypothetical protein ACJ76I_11815 [Gaiellaceae bacterium]